MANLNRFDAGQLQPKAGQISSVMGWLAAQALLALAATIPSQASPAPLRPLPAWPLPAWLCQAQAKALAPRPLPARLHLAEALPIPQIPRDNWKDCSFNDRLIGCQDRELADGVRIDWRDGRSMTYRLIREGFPLSLLRDRYGGLWQRIILVQGNAVYTNVLPGKPDPGKPALGKSAQSNRIVVPLRLPCKPPLVGEVGYCQRP